MPTQLLKFFFTRRILGMNTLSLKVSTASPSNCTGTNVISVGAVDEDLYASANGSNVIMGYSSKRPVTVE